VITDLGTLQAGGAGFAFGQELNDSDTVVGGSSTSGETVFHAFVWTQATGMVDLGTLGGSQSFANSVNGASQIVGWADTASGRQHAFLDQSGHMTDLGTLGGAQSEARSINLSGEIVGWADTAGGKQDAFIRTGSNLVDIGRLLTDATSSVANDVDNNGDVVGTAQTATGEYSWLYIGGRMINITRNTVTCCDIVGGALNKTLQITERGDLTSAYVPLLEAATVYDELNGRIVYRGTWSRTARAGAWGGHIKSSTANGASATFTFTGRRVWWVAPVGSGFGVAKLYLDGAFQRTVNLGQGFGRRAPVYQRGFPAVGSHTLRIVVSGSGAKVSVDAFAVSQT
jgi:probable HAF family extracellular repeat protein